MHELRYGTRDTRPLPYFRVAISPDSQLVAAIDLHAQFVHVWNMGTEASVVELQSDDADLPLLAFGVDGRWLAMSGGRNLRVFDTRSWLQVFVIEGARARALSFDPSGTRLLVGTAVGDVAIDKLPVRYAAIATEIGTGHEIWITRGRLTDALRASYALPGIFPPVRLGGRWLVDGALVNPVPVSVARALGARLVIAVNVNTDLFGRGTAVPDLGNEPEPSIGESDGRGPQRCINGDHREAGRSHGMQGLDPH